MKGRGFIVHAALTSTLDGLPGDARAAVIGAAYARVRGLDDYELPKKFAVYRFLVDGIVTAMPFIEARSKRSNVAAGRRSGMAR